MTTEEAHGRLSRLTEASTICPMEKQMQKLKERATQPAPGATTPPAHVCFVYERKKKSPTVHQERVTHSPSSQTWKMYILGSDNLAGSLSTLGQDKSSKLPAGQTDLSLGLLVVSGGCGCRKCQSLVSPAPCGRMSQGTDLSSCLFAVFLLRPQKHV